MYENGLLKRLVSVTFAATTTGVGDFIVDGLASGEAFVHAVPVSNSRFTKLPAKQNNLAFHYAGEIEEADFEILNLHASSGNFSERVRDALCKFVPFGAQVSQGNDVHGKSAMHHDALVDLLKLPIDFLNAALAVRCPAQQGFQNGKEIERFV